MKDTFLITGATGKIGSLVIEQLRAKDARVRALVRDAAKAEGLKKLGVELVTGDFDDQAAVVRALEGISAVLLVTPPHPDAAVMVERFLAAAAAAKSRPRIVRISALHASEHGPTANTRSHGRADSLIQGSGLPYVILRPNLFMQNIFGLAESITTSGKIYQGMGDGRLGFIDVRDIADAAVAALRDRSWDYAMVELTGPASLTWYEVAKELAGALGRPVDYVPVPPEAIGDTIRKMGWGEWAAEVMTDYSRAYAAGFGDYVSAFVEKMAGHPPRGLSQFAREVFAPALKR